MFTTTTRAFLTLAALSFVAAQGGTRCNSTSLCPTTAPCCSEFGFCGTDSFCLGGCNPFSSNKPDSCRPNPLCKSGTYNFKDMSRIQTKHDAFDGNATAFDWVVDSGNIQPSADNSSIALTLNEKNMGTRISSTRYVHYGEISAKVQTGKWPGVVTAFITMSNIKDEIDWEFTGKAVTEGQSNFFFQGDIPDLTQGDKHAISSDASANWHTYSINWQPDTLTFAVDGKTVRTVNKKDTANAAGADGFRYPTTPARVQFSIWPGGANTSAPGTIEWAGGPINFNDPDYKSAGNFWASIQEVTIKCADDKAPAQDTTGYVYGNGTKPTSPNVAFTNTSTLVNAAMPGALAVPAHTMGALVLAVVGALAAQLL